jgi:hypothetical protein
VTEKIDVFIRIAPCDAIRFGIAYACMFRWVSDPLVRLRVILPTGLNMWGDKEIWDRLMPRHEVLLPGENFHFTSRQYADEHADTEPYLMVDDDEMPLGEDWVERAVKLWRLYNSDRKYVMMVGRPMLTVEDAARHHERLRNSKQEVEEMSYWWGCPYMSYRGAMPYAKMNGRADQQDPTVEAWAKANGKKQALCMGLYYNHFGLSFSQVQPALYGRF